MRCFGLVFRRRTPSCRSEWNSGRRGCPSSFPPQMMMMVMKKMERRRTESGGGAGSGAGGAPPTSPADHAPNLRLVSWYMGLVRVHSRSLRMAFQRRRQKERRRIPWFSTATLVSGAAVFVLTLLALLFFLGPPLIDHQAFPSSGRHVRSSSTSPILVKLYCVFSLEFSTFLLFSFIFFPVVYMRFGASCEDVSVRGSRRRSREKIIGSADFRCAG